jgi:predicted HTH transcriptional regulator
MKTKSEVNDMPFRESETVELKSMVVDDVKKEIVAFANSCGSTLYVDITDDGDVIGISNAEADLTNINNMMRHGTSSVPATDTAIRNMIRETDGESYEKLRSTQQELTNVFRMILPNMNATPIKKDPGVREFAREHGSINRKQTQQLLGVSQTAAGVLLR